MSLEGKIAIVTGSSRNIGRAIALRLAKDGADMFVHYRPGEPVPEDVAGEVRDLGRKAWILRGDVRKLDDIRAMFDQIREEAGRLDILVNNAAMGAAKSAMAIRPNQWDMTLEISARSILLCTQQAVPLMSEGGGRIVNISSLGAHRVLPDYAAIGASKAIVENLTRTFAVELADKGIGVNCVCGGIIDTGTLQHLGPTMEAQKVAYVERCPNHRLGKPEDMANVVSFLCSEDASWVVGQTIIADGGFSLI